MHTTHPDSSPTWGGVKVGHLVIGLVLLGAAGVWALTTTGAITFDHGLPLLLPGLLVGAGLIGLAATAIGAASSGRADRKGAKQAEADYWLSDRAAEPSTEDTSVLPDNEREIT